MKKQEVEEKGKQVLEKVKGTGSGTRSNRAMNVGELEGARNLVSIECSCGAVWIRYGNKALDKRERQQFIAKHSQHDLKGFHVTSKVTRR